MQETPTLSIQVQCVNKTDRESPHERISHIGGFRSDKSKWTLSQADAITGIEAGRWAFYVARGGRRVGVVVVIGRGGPKYLKTVGDGEQPEALLSLPDCG